MSTVEQRRAGMIKTVSGGYRGTLGSTERKRANFIAQEGLPNIPYFTFSEMQEFIRTNGGQWDGQSFCGTTEGYIGGNCTINSLLQIQNTRAVSNTPLFIPVKADWQEWTPIQIEAFAKQNIKVTKISSTDYTSFRGTKKYKKNVAYYNYNSAGDYYPVYLKQQQAKIAPTIIFSDPQQKPATPPMVTPATPPMVTPAVSIAGPTAPPTPSTPSRISVFPFVIIGILAIVFIIIWRGRK